MVSRMRRLMLVAEILAAYVKVRWRLRRRDVVSVVDSLRPPSSRRSGPVDERASGRGLARAVVRTLTLLPTDSRCLTRSLVLTSLLARRGIESRLVLGVRHRPAFAAHAWVEHEQVPLLPAGEPTFERIAEL